MPKFIKDEIEYLEEEIISLEKEGDIVNANKIKAEIEKCDLLCANCHRELHAELDKLNQKTIEEIKEARENVKKGEYYTEVEAKKIINI